MKFKKSYKELSIKEYIDVFNILTSESKTKGLDLMRVLAVDKESFNQTPINIINGITGVGSFLEESIESEELKKSYKIAGREFSCVNNPDRLITSQFIDLASLTKNITNSFDILHNICSVFLVPKGYVYGEGYDVVELADWLLENCPITIANSIGFFLFKRKQQLLQSSLLYLEGQIKLMKLMKNNSKQKEMIKQMELDLDTIKRGCGIFLSTKYAQ